MAAPTGEIYILAPRYQLVSGHSTQCPYGNSCCEQQENKIGGNRAVFTAKPSRVQTKNRAEINQLG